jgi:signal transduction histidine kinase
MNSLETQTRFIETLSCELRVPLSGIAGMSELLALQDLGADNRTVVESICQSSARLLQIVNSMTEINPVTISCNKFAIRATMGDVRQLASLHLTDRNISISSFCDSRLPEYLFGDESRIRQILLQLAFNALRHTQSGEVRLSCVLNDESSEYCKIQFNVEDTREGLFETDKDSVFNDVLDSSVASIKPIYGTGVHLSTCKKLVELMGGSLDFRSEPAKGTHFWFEIPLRKNECEELS